MRELREVICACKGFLRFLHLGGVRDKGQGRGAPQSCKPLASFPGFIKLLERERMTSLVYTPSLMLSGVTYSVTILRDMPLNHAEKDEVCATDLHL